MMNILDLGDGEFEVEFLRNESRESGHARQRPLEAASAAADEASKKSPAMNVLRVHGVNEEVFDLSGERFERGTLYVASSKDRQITFRRK